LNSGFMLVDGACEVMSTVAIKEKAHLGK
jgi:hypothetical protein